eukprot:1127737-Prorocentrum_minimum.AAC.1
MWGVRVDVKGAHVDVKSKGARADVRDPSGDVRGAQLDVSVEAQREFTEEYEDPFIVSKLSAAINNVKQTASQVTGRGAEGGGEVQDFTGNVTKATMLLHQVTRSIRHVYQYRRAIGTARGEWPEATGRLRAGAGKALSLTRHASDACARAIGAL